MLWYFEYRSGQCYVIIGFDEERAREKLPDSYVYNDPIVVTRQASDDDIDWIKRLGKEIVP